MSSERPPYDLAPILPDDAAFVVHFRMGRPRRRFAGRVEHLATGASAHFRSLRELLGFFDRLLQASRTIPR